MPEIENMADTEATGHRDEYEAPEKPVDQRLEEDAQDGVRVMEAMTLSWSKTSLALVYFWYVESRIYNDLLSLRFTLIQKLACGCSTLPEP